MNLLKILHESEEFKKFKHANENAYLCAEFLILDFETGKDSYQIDYCLEDGKIATFSLGENFRDKVSDSDRKSKDFRQVEMQLCDNLGKGKLSEIKQIKLSPEELKEIAITHLKNKQLTKIIAVLQNINDEEIWNLTCITKGLAIIRLKIKDSNSQILESKDASLFDIVKRVK